MWYENGKACLFYKKPTNMRFVDLAIYIDEHLYDNPKTKEVGDNIYKYLYILYTMLACKSKYITDRETLDNFGVFATTDFWLTVNNGIINNRPPIKHCLNYMRHTLYFKYLDFMSDTYEDGVTFSYEKLLENNDTEFTLEQQLSFKPKLLNRVEFKVTLEQIPLIVKSVVNKTPFNSQIKDNIYLSCILTMLDYFTLSEKDINRDEFTYLQSEIKFYDNLYIKNRTEVILYGLDENMHDLIDVLCRQVKHIILEALQTGSYGY